MVRAKGPLLKSNGGLENAARLEGPSAAVFERGQADLEVGHGGGSGVLLLSDREGTAQVGLALFGAALRGENCEHVGESRGEGRGVGTEIFLVNRQGQPLQLLGSGVPASIGVEGGEVVPGDGGIESLGARGLLDKSKASAQDGFGARKLAFSREDEADMGRVKPISRVSPAASAIATARVASG